MVLCHEFLVFLMSSPTFSERQFHCRNRVETAVDVEDGTPTKQTVVAPVKKTVSLGPLPDVVRAHRLPLTMKSKSGDTLQVYLRGFPRKSPDLGLVYDIEFDDLSPLEGVPRNALTIPPETAYRILLLQESQSTGKRTPTREERKKLRRNK